MEDYEEESSSERECEASLFSSVIWIYCCIVSFLLSILHLCKSASSLHCGSLLFGV